MRLDQRGARAARRARRRPPHDRAAHAGRAAGDVRPRGRRGGVPRRRPAGGAGSPYLDLDALERALRGRRGGRGVGRLGLRRRAPGVRRAVRTAGHRVRRAERRRDAPPRRQDRRQAARRAGRRAGRAVERRAGRTRWTRPARHAAHDRLPADDQGHGGWRRPRASGGSTTTPGSPRRSRAPVPRAARRSAMPTVFMERVVDGRPPRRGADHRRRPRHGVGRAASATAACSAATRR